jgi:hypothetical protein
MSQYQQEGYICIKYVTISLVNFIGHFSIPKPHHSFSIKSDLILTLINEAISSTDYIISNNRIVGNKKLEGIWKKIVV